MTIDGEDRVNGRRRRYYRISETGRQAVIAEVERMRSSVAVADELVDGSAGAVAG